MIDFCIGFLAILAPSWEPSWGHVDVFFAGNGATLNEALLFFIALTFFLEFSAVMTSSSLYFAHGPTPRPQASIFTSLASISLFFGRHVGSVSGTVLLLFWSISTQELFLDLAFH